MCWGCLSGVHSPGAEWLGAQEATAAVENSLNNRWVPLFSLFLFEKFLLFKPPGPNKHLASHTAQPGSLPRILQQTLRPRPGASAVLVPALAFSPHPSTPPQPNPPPSPTSTLPLDFVHVSFIVAPIALFLQSHFSMSSTIFGLQSSYILEYFWLFAVFLRSARHFTGAEGKWTPLPPILPLSSGPHATYFQYTIWFNRLSDTQPDHFRCYQKATHIYLMEDGSNFITHFLSSAFAPLHSFFSPYETQGIF